MKYRIDFDITETDVPSTFEGTMNEVLAHCEDCGIDKAEISELLNEVDRKSKPCLHKNFVNNGFTYYNLITPIKEEEVENQEEVTVEVKQLSSKEKIDIMLKTRGQFRDDIIELLKVEMDGEKTQSLKDIEDLFQKAMTTLYEADEVLKYGNPLEFIEGKEEAAKKEIEEFVDSLNEIEEDATFDDLMRDSENIGSLDIYTDELDGFVTYLESKSERTSDEESALDMANRLTDEIAEANSKSESAQEIAHELFDKLEDANELLRDCARVQSEMRNEFVD